MTFTSENTTRKIDGLGRISIPKSLRDRLGIDANDELEFSMCQDGNKRYICLNKKVDEDMAEKVERLISELDALGVEIPDQLLDMVQ